jgi:hypothetical protein
MNCSVKRWFLLLAVMAAGLDAEGLSWTDQNLDRNCEKARETAKTVVERLQPCSQARITQADIEAGGVKTYALFVYLHLYPIIPEYHPDSVFLSIVLETADHVKHTYTRENLRIKTKTEHVSPEELPADMRSKYPDGLSITGRSCDTDIGIDVGVVSVLAIDASEKDAKGRTVAAHTFR